MGKIHHTIRIITGLLFLAVFFSKMGLLPSAVNSPEFFTIEGFKFITAVKETGYLFPWIGLASLVGALTFLSNRYVAIGAIILLPLTLNFAVFHIVLGFSIDSTFHFFREMVPHVFLVLNLYMLYSARKSLAGLFEREKVGI